MRGQVAIWVIIGVVLVASIILFFLLSPSSKLLKPAESDVSFDVQSFMDSCATEAVNEAVDLMLPHGGFIQPKNTVFFDNQEVEYLCFNRLSFDPCINQHPALINEVKQEIKEYITPKIEGCFDEMKVEFERRGGERVSFNSGLNVKVGLAEDKVILDIEKSVTIEKQGETRRFESLKTVVANPIYGFVVTATEIVSQESTFCYFEYVGYSFFYPRYKIKTYELSRPTTIYTIEDKNSGKIMNFAVRSCAITPGGF